ncbi:hypothetical protein [Cellulomonas sp. P5_E12]
MALPVGGDQGIVGTVVKRTNPLVYNTQVMKYLVEFDGLGPGASQALLTTCACDPCERSNRRIAKKGAQGLDFDALMADRRAQCRSDWVMPNGRSRIWLNKFQIFNYTGKNRLPNFLY